MNIETLQNIIIQAISSNTPLLNDFSIGSINYTLARGISGGLLDLYKKLEDLETNFLLPDAQGDYLDTLGNSLGINRLNGNTGLGYVLANNLVSRNVAIPNDLVLTNPITLQQYISTETSTINIPGYTEERIKIESLEATEKANVSAGTVLINDRFPQVNFVIGNYRNINGEVSGDILTALNPESDLLYRERLLSSIINPSSNYIYLRNLILNQGDIANVLFHTPEPGYVNVWLRVKTTISNSRLNALQQLINENMFIGIQPSVKLLNPKGISFKVRVYNIQFNQGLVTNIREYINYYLDNLSYRESLVKSSLEQYLKLKTRTLVEVVIPQDEIFIAEEQQCFTLNSLEVIYNV